MVDIRRAANPVRAALGSLESQLKGGETMASEANATFKVVVNDEEQYSIWFADREPPAGWKVVGKEGPKEECLTYIDEVWTDMRPLSLRKQMEQAG
jgi:MbtH protein